VPERRAFLAHVPVARVRRGARVRAAERPGPDRLEMRADRVTLFRSRLERAGARYEPLATVRLATGSP
jgi:2'-5' RNA ligase